MTRNPINLAAKLAAFTEPWTPRVAEINDYQFKLVKLAGDFVWHRHDDTDEVFIVLAGATHGLTHVALALRDPERSLAFYRDVGGAVAVHHSVDHRLEAARARG